MKLMTEQAKALCHCVLRRPERLDALAERARAGNADAVESVICVAWLMTGMVASLESALALAVDDAVPADDDPLSLRVQLSPVIDAAGTTH